MEKTVSGVARTERSRRIRYSRPVKIKHIKTNNFVSMTREEYEFKEFRKRNPHLNEELARERFAERVII